MTDFAKQSALKRIRDSRKKMATPVGVSKHIPTRAWDTLKPGGGKIVHRKPPFNIWKNKLSEVLRQFPSSVLDRLRFDSLGGGGGTYTWPEHPEGEGIGLSGWTFLQKPSSDFAVPRVLSHELSHATIRGFPKTKEPMGSFSAKEIAHYMEALQPQREYSYYENPDELLARAGEVAVGYKPRDPKMFPRPKKWEIEAIKKLMKVAR